MKNYLLRLIDIAMKLSFFGFFVKVLFFNLVLAGSTEAQKYESVKEVYVKIDIEKATLTQLFSELEKLTDFHFTYNDVEISRNSSLISIASGEKSLESILLQVSKEANLRFKQVNNNINVNRNQDLQSNPIVEIVLQGPEIQGTVTSAEDNTGLPGVSVLVKGTTIGTITQLDGTYSLTIPEDAKTLVFSFVGYKNQEVAINSRSVIDIILDEDLTALEEVVVIGYGSQERKDLTGSVSSIDATEIEGLNISSADQMLQGRLAGVNVKQASAAPGGLTSVRIRGSNSFLGSNEPLYVIDGVPIFNDANEVNTYSGPGSGSRINHENPLAFLNPADIESINVLKDASATSIYGARGSNGVIIITTKRGKAGEGKLDLNYSNGWQNAIMLPEMMSTQQFQAYLQQHQSNTSSPEYDAGLSQPYSFADTLPSTNWLEEQTRPAQVRNFNLTASGGNENLTYSVGGSYFDQEGVLLGSDLKRFGMKVNLDAQVNDRIRVGNSLIASRTENNFAWVDGTANGIFGMGSITAGMLTYPFHPVYDDNGQPFRNNANYANAIMRSPYPMNHPLALLTDQQDKRKMNRILGNLFTEYSILDNLKLKVSVGANIDSRDNTIYYTSNLTQGSRLIRHANNMENYVNENTLNYNLLSGDHSIDAVAGFSVQYNMVNTFFSQDANFPFDRLGADADGQGTDLLTTSSARSKWTMASYLARVNYGFQGKYLVTASVRADGSSRFAEDNKWGVFPAAAFAWRISEESFMDQVSQISNLKTRVSWGTTGNTEIGTNQSNLILGNGRYSFNGNEVSTFYPAGPENNALKWESTKQTDIGIDLGLFNDLLAVTFDAYWKRTDDLLVSVQLDPLTGFGSALMNIGGIENKGFEFNITGNWIKTNDFGWSTNINYAQYRNKVTEISPLEDEFTVSGAVERGEYRSLIKVGAPLGSFFGFQTDGLITQADIDAGVAHTVSTPELGDIKFVDQLTVDTDNDGVPDATDGVINADDRVAIGNPHPDFTFGINNNFRYKIFDFSALISGSIGHDIFNTSAYHGRDPEQMRTNKYASLLNNSWTPENPDAKYPRAGSEASDGIFKANETLAIEDGSYVKIQNISLGVNLNRSIIKFAQNLRVYVSAQNLAVWTDYEGTSPEVNSGGQSTTNLGYETGGYPMARTIMLGVNLSL